jgi:hypothetical protein
MTKLNKQQSSDLWFITDLAGFAPTEVLDGFRNQQWEYPQVFSNMGWKILH